MDRKPLSVPDSLQGADREYFLTHGAFPPTVGEGTTPDDLRSRIESMSLVADGTKSAEDATKLIHEIGYLSDKLAQMTGQFKG